MVLPQPLRKHLTPAEIQYLSENEPITILPRYSMSKVNLIGQSIPSLKGMKRVEVPLWVALILKKQGKCNILAPDWLSHTHLSEMYELERSRPEMFSNLPWNWLEVSKLLLAKAADDLQDSSTQLRSIIQDLREIRQSKARKGLRELNESNIQLNGLTLMEINEIRPFVINVMGKLQSLHGSAVGGQEEEDDQASDYE